MLPAIPGYAEPQAQGTPPPQEAPPPGATAAMLLGPAPGTPAPVSPAPPAGNPADAVMMQIRELNMGVEALVRQFPVAAEPGRAIMQGLTDMMVLIVGSLGSVESEMTAPTPRLIA